MNMRQEDNECQQECEVMCLYGACFTKAPSCMGGMVLSVI